MKSIEFIKDKSSLKYYLISIICILCVYSSLLIKLFSPLLDNIYYGNITDVLINSFSLVLWALELIILCLLCKKFNINIFSTKENKHKELPLLRLIILFIFSIIPMLAVSIYLDFTIKIVYELGVKVTVWGFVQNAINMVSYIIRFAFITIFINCIHLGFEKNIKFNNEKFNKYFPFGAIFSFLVFGILDLIFISNNLKVFYLLMSFVYGIVYLLSDRKFATTFIVSYLIWLL